MHEIQVLSTTTELPLVVTTTTSSSTYFTFGHNLQTWQVHLIGSCIYTEKGTHAAF